MYPTPTELPDDAILKELIPEFVSAWKRDLSTEWPAIIASGNLEDFRRFGHTIKGSFLQFGFKDLAQVGKDIMEDSTTGDWETATTRVESLIAILISVESLYSDTKA